jgi:hypothetical protein
LDTAIQNREAAFKNSFPGVFAGTEKYHIEFKDSYAFSAGFYEEIINRIKAGDFSLVIISLENDRISGETALELRRWAYEGEIPPEKLKICIRAQDHSALLVADVLNPYSKDPSNVIRIDVFGCDKEIFTLDNIINEDADILAKHIAENYSNDSANEYPVNWEQLINHERDSNRYAALFNLCGFNTPPLCGVILGVWGMRSPTSKYAKMEV